MKSTLVTGGTSAVASYIDYGKGYTREELDVSNYTLCEKVLEEEKPDVVIHLAALTDLGYCEKHSDEAHLINTIGTENLAKACEKVGAKLVYVSTDAVFPHQDIPHPIEETPRPESVYGKTKLQGEIAVQTYCPDHIIARTAWVFGGGKEKDKKFVGKFIANLDNPDLKAVTDQRSSPTYAKDLVAAIQQLVSENKTGLFHVINLGTASRYDMAQVIAEGLRKTVAIEPVLGSAFNLQTFQTSSGGLVPNISLRPWQDALREYIATEWNLG